MSLFLNADFELRSGPRCALYVAVFAIALFVTLSLLGPLFPDLEPSLLTRLLANALVLFPPAASALWFMARLIDRVPVGVFGVGFHERWGRDFNAGLLVAALMLVLYVGAGALAAPLTIAGGSAGGEPARALLLVPILALAAANEELIFRGYLLQVLMAGVGREGAILIVSGVFGLGHHLNPGATWLGTTNTFLAGVLLCLAYLRTRSLWLPFGIHLGWNAGLGVILGFPVSGVRVPALLESRLAGPDWLTGGAFGPEGGILGSGVIIAAVVLIAGSGSWPGVSPRIQALLDRYSTRTYIPHDADGKGSVTSGGS